MRYGSNSLVTVRSTKVTPTKGKIAQPKRPVVGANVCVDTSPDFCCHPRFRLAPASFCPVTWKHSPPDPWLHMVFFAPQSALYEPWFWWCSDTWHPRCRHLNRFASTGGSWIPLHKSKISASRIHTQNLVAVRAIQHSPEGLISEISVSSHLENRLDLCIGACFFNFL